MSLSQKVKKADRRIDCYNTASTKPVDFSFLTLENVTGMLHFPVHFIFSDYNPSPNCTTQIYSPKKQEMVISLQ